MTDIREAAAKVCEEMAEGARYVYQREEFTEAAARIRALPAQAEPVAIGVGLRTGETIYAPQPPADMVLDAERYRYWRNLSGPIPGMFLRLCGEELDAEIDRAMLSAKEQG